MNYAKRGELPERQGNFDVYGFHWALNLTDEAQLTLIRVLDIGVTILVKQDYVQWAKVVAIPTFRTLLIVKCSCHALTSLTASYSSSVGGRCSTV